MAQIEWIPVSSGQRPRDKETVIVTVLDSYGDRFVMDSVRFISHKGMVGEYTIQYAEKHPDGIWEWAYEAGADYLEEISQHEKVIAWAYMPEPYKGE